jgi:hypothetical protein
VIVSAVIMRPAPTPNDCRRELRTFFAERESASGCEISGSQRWVIGGQDCVVNVGDTNPQWPKKSTLSLVDTSAADRRHKEVRTFSPNHLWRNPRGQALQTEKQAPFAAQGCSCAAAERA